VLFDVTAPYINLTPRASTSVVYIGGVTVLFLEGVNKFIRAPSISPNRFVLNYLQTSTHVIKVTP
jgi:hypothetical protein